MSRRVLDLGGDNWWLGQAPAKAHPEQATWDELEQVMEWLPATVPGNVRADLVRAGRLPDPFVGTQTEAAQWVDGHCWWLIRDFSFAALRGDRVHLALRGVDYVWDLFLNGHYLGRREGMFSSQIYDITDILQAENRLAVRVVGSRWLPANRSSLWIRFLNLAESKAGKIARRFPQRRDTLKCQMSHGWDFAPPLRNMGIWDDVYAVTTGDLFIRDVATRSHVSGGEAQVTIDVELDAITVQNALVRCTLSGATFDSEPIVVERPVTMMTSTSRQTVTLSLAKPCLWWPWDHGRPDLYRLTVEVWVGGQLHDLLVRTIGLREVELDDWTLRINGQRVYARGANWVPADILPGHVTEADYRALLSLARQANMNLLRVWGGGLREKQAFYDLCDQLGILVWQEFPLACTFLTRFPRSPEYLRLVENEARAIVRDLRDHASLVLWCGGNEFNPKRNLPVVSTLQQAVAHEDPTRPFLLASPANGDSHNWDVWHHFRSPSAYRDDQALFASEFGLQSPPDTKTLERFLPADELWPPGPSWAHHGADLTKLWRYARPFLSGEETSLEAFVQASQRAQAHGLQIAIEHYRRRKAHGVGGVVVWQLNEPWPAISWAIIDYYRQPKPAYETVRQLFDPLLVSVDYPPKRYQAGDDLSFDTWIVNDRQEALPGCQVEVVLWDGAGQVTNRSVHGLEVAADSAAMICHQEWTLPPGGGWRLTCRLLQGSRIQAANEYDLGLYDGIQPTASQRFRAWISRLVVPS